MKIKLKALLLATTTIGVLAGGVLAQTSPPAAARPPPVAAPLTPAQPAFDLNQLPATHGTVKYFTLTPRGDVDGFLLADGTQVHVPPHLSTQLVAAVRLGDTVTVHGLRAAAVPMVAAMSVTGDASGQMVVDAGPPGGPGRGPGGRPDRGPGGPPPPPPGGPAADPPSEVSGKVLAVLHGPRGEANGAMLEDGTVLRMLPPEAARLAAMLAPGQSVVAQGPGIANNLGRMMNVRAIGASHEQLTAIEAPLRFAAQAVQTVIATDLGVVAAALKRTVVAHRHPRPAALTLRRLRPPPVWRRPPVPNPEAPGRGGDFLSGAHLDQQEISYALARA